MADFQFRTRGQKSPQGLQRVYFTCHPDDFEKFFEDIQKEILDRQDCAVFYLEPNTQPEDVEDYELRLREVQLFVVPVTTKLLTKANRAMDIEVPFAFENHIPVLPLMQENGLDDVFNKKFGDLQYLDKYNTDPTAIPYEEKLTKYLESVIVGDELAKKVRAAFDAYIFLSYRKKDRKHAQELMKLIHSNPLCRDIAIWYDEFLTPGENFNEAIRAALEKSELFALAVTPNLINEINYILTTEYPMARDMGKKILPAEMETTNMDKLNELYTELPELIANGDKATLTERLSNFFESLAIRENDTDSQHNFLIGLAYLSGIDVEVNKERAFDLIYSSAKNEYIPAIDQLVKMYDTGEGVERNFNNAVKWLEKLVKLREKTYKEAPCKGTAEELLCDYWDLGTAYLSLGEWSKAKGLFEKMKDYSEQFTKQYNNVIFDLLESTSCNCLGKLAQKQGMLEEAGQWYLKAMTITDTLSQEHNVSQNQRPDLAYSYDNLGNIAKERGKLDEAERWYRKSLEIREDFLNEINSIEYRRDLSISYVKLGNVFRYKGKLDEAEYWYRKSLENDKSISKDSGIIESHLTVSYEKLGHLAEARGELNDAIQFFYKSLEIEENNVKEYASISTCSDLSSCYLNLCRVTIVRGSLNEAEELIYKSLSYIEDLFSEVNTIGLQRELAAHYGMLGVIYQLKKEPAIAEKWYRKGLDVFENLYVEINTTDMQTDLSITYSNLGDVNEAQGKHNEAKQWYHKALSMCENVFEETNTLVAMHGVFLCLIKLGDNAISLQEYIEAGIWYKKSLYIAKKISEGSSTIESYDDLALSNFKLGFYLSDRNMLEQALSIWQKLAKISPNNPTYLQRVHDVEQSIQLLFSE